MKEFIVKIFNMIKYSTNYKINDNFDLLLNSDYSSILVFNYKSALRYGADVFQAKATAINTYITSLEDWGDKDDFIKKWVYIPKEYEDSYLV